MNQTKKPDKTKKKLVLARETIRQVSHDQLRYVAGAGSDACGSIFACNTRI